MRILSLIKNNIISLYEKNNQKYYTKHKEEYSVDQFKNKYDGQECFIVGNGPSLRPEDLDLIYNRNFVTFASNRIHKIYNETIWRPTYFTISDGMYIYDRDTLSKIVETKPEAFFTRSQFTKYLKGINCNVFFLDSNISRELLDSPQFSNDCNCIIYDIATVTYFSIQIAAYMGFKKIYLIGMDNIYTYSKLRDGSIVRNEGVGNYFGNKEKEIPDPSKAISTWEMDVAYEFADKYSREHGFRIYNATRGGFLEKFERVNLDEILKVNDE